MTVTEIAAALSAHASAHPAYRRGTAPSRIARNAGRGCPLMMPVASGAHRSSGDDTPSGMPLLLAAASAKARRISLREITTWCRSLISTRRRSSCATCRRGKSLKMIVRPPAIRAMRVTAYCLFSDDTIVSPRNPRRCLPKQSCSVLSGRESANCGRDAATLRNGSRNSLTSTRITSGASKAERRIRHTSCWCGSPAPSDSASLICCADSEDGCADAWQRSATSRTLSADVSSTLNAFDTPLLERGA